MASLATCGDNKIHCANNIIVKLVDNFSLVKNFEEIANYLIFPWHINPSQNQHFFYLSIYFVYRNFIYQPYAEQHTNHTVVIISWTFIESIKHCKRGLVDLNICQMPFLSQRFQCQSLKWFFPLPFFRFDLLKSVWFCLFVVHDVNEKLCENLPLPPCGKYFTKTRFFSGNQFNSSNSHVRPPLFVCVCTFLTFSFRCRKRKWQSNNDFLTASVR